MPEDSNIDWLEDAQCDHTEFKREPDLDEDEEDPRNGE